MSLTPAESYNFLAHFKFHFPTLPKSHRHYWSDLSFRYAEAFTETLIPIRFVSTTLSDLGDEESRWNDISNWFLTPFDMDRIAANIVCGSSSELRKFYTEACPYNIAITDAYPREHTDQELKSLERYDEVWIRSWDVERKLSKEARHRLRIYVVPSTDLDPLTDRLREISGRFRR